MGYLDGDPYGPADYADDMRELDGWADTVSKIGRDAQTSQQIIATVATIHEIDRERGPYENSYAEAYNARVHHMAERYGPPVRDLQWTDRHCKLPDLGEG